MYVKTFVRDAPMAATTSTKPVDKAHARVFSFFGMTNGTTRGRRNEKKTERDRDVVVKTAIPQSTKYVHAFAYR